MTVKVINYWMLFRTSYAEKQGRGAGHLDAERGINRAM